MKVAIIHDYLYVYGGAERVLEALHKIWPDAPIYTAWADFKWIKKEKKEWQDWDIRTSWLQKVPIHKKLTSPLRFLTPWIWEKFDLKEYDVVVSSSAWFMPKSVVTMPETLHLCYLHTPPRYLYGYRTARDYRRFWFGRLYAAIVNPFMRYYDYLSSQRVDYFVCNSKEVKKRIKKFYRRDAEVIYPPILSSKSENLKADAEEENEYFLMVNRLVRHKNIDLAIKAFKKTGEKLIIAGTGRDEKRLKKIADGAGNIKFMGYVKDKRLNKLYTNSKAVLYLAEEEDFGITPLEAMAFGKPVIALKSGGVKETIESEKTGVFLKKKKVVELVKLLNNFNVERFDKKACINKAEQFKEEEFIKKIKRTVRREYARIA